MAKKPSQQDYKREAERLGASERDAKKIAAALKAHQDGHPSVQR